MLADTRIILCHGPYEALAQRHEIMWRDGSAVGLHPVHAHGMPMLTLRVLAPNPGGSVVAWQLFDVARLCPELDADLRTCATRDVPGHVFYTLRQRYAGAREFAAAVNRCQIGAWLPMVDVDKACAAGHVWWPAPRAHDAQALDIATAEAPRARAAGRLMEAAA